VTRLLDGRDADLGGAAIGIIIVTYNSAAEIGACLDAAIRTGADIVVVDNASRDGTVAEIERRDVRLIANSENRGFAAAVNQGFAVLNATYVLLLNPDSVLLTGLGALCDACDLPGSAGAGGRLLDASGQPQIGFMVRQLPSALTLVMEALLLNRIWPGNAVNRRYRLLGRDFSTQFPVEQPAGAFLMVRRAVWEDLGGFDETFYPVWFEDVDFCRRIQQRGLSLYYVPNAVAKHTGGHSVAHLSVEMRRVYWYRSLLRYSARHFRPRAFRAVCAAVLLGSVLRSVVESALHRSLKPIATYGLVARLAGRCMVFGFRP
jgi:N-acetylglucosaminyl-diphospho-decaprenol L-rhamnosyltransferase